MKRPTLSLGLVIAATMLAACSSGASPSAVPPTLNGKTYLSTAVQGKILAPGTRIQLGFKDGQVSASGGCNSMGGAYTITGNRLSATQLITTDMGCDQPRMQQDQWLAKLLGGVTVTLAGDTLTLDDGATHMTMLDREIANPDKPIAGTTWVLDGIVTGSTASSVPTGVTASIVIANGHVDVESGCNTGGATVTVQPNALTFGPMVLTKRACQAEAMAVESAMTGVLRNTAAYSIDADVLTITTGDAGLTFRAAP
jgi:heat shock protein HslJ